MKSKLSSEVEVSDDCFTIEQQRKRSKTDVNMPEAEVTNSTSPNFLNIIMNACQACGTSDIDSLEMLCPSAHRFCIKCIDNWVKQAITDRTRPKCLIADCPYALKIDDLDELPITMKSRKILVELIKEIQVEHRDSTSAFRVLCEKCDLFIDPAAHFIHTTHCVGRTMMIPCELCFCPIHVNDYDQHVLLCKDADFDQISRFITEHSRVSKLDSRRVKRLVEHKLKKTGKPIDVYQMVATIDSQTSIDQSCSFCFQTIDTNDVVLLNCALSHVFCNACFKKSVEDQIAREQVLTCRSCEYFLQNKDLNQKSIWSDARITELENYQELKSIEYYKTMFSDTEDTNTTTDHLCPFCSESTGNENIFILTCQCRICYTCFAQTVHEQKNTTRQILKCPYCANVITLADLRQLRLEPNELQEIESYQHDRIFDLEFENIQKSSDRNRISNIASGHGVNTQHNQVNQEYELKLLEQQKTLPKYWDLPMMSNFGRYELSRESKEFQCVEKRFISNWKTSYRDTYGSRTYGSRTYANSMFNSTLLPLNIRSSNQTGTHNRISFTPTQPFQQPSGCAQSSQVSLSSCRIASQPPQSVQLPSDPSQQVHILPSTMIPSQSAQSIQLPSTSTHSEKKRLTLHDDSSAAAAIETTSESQPSTLKCAWEKLLSSIFGEKSDDKASTTDTSSIVAQNANEISLRPMSDPTCASNSSNVTTTSFDSSGESVTVPPTLTTTFLPNVTPVTSDDFSQIILSNPVSCQLSSHITGTVFSPMHSQASASNVGTFPSSVSSSQTYMTNNSTDYARIQRNAQLLSQTYAASADPQPPALSSFDTRRRRHMRRGNIVPQQYNVDPSDHVPTIVRIERIQNQRWFKQYAAHELEFQELQKPPALWLFHGCDEISSRNIEVDCFNRSFAGRHATAFGQGCYFARYSSYSDRYSHPNDENIRKMFLARVLVGSTTRGDSSMRVPPRGYDSTGDESDVFVTYHDSQAYAEYLISYRR